ncbi:BQ5605_C004g02668 [Microbotryum silenes-dioicae]|uniref:BQ5605_C004g02668 protein n=1 Tax=Microbotryum silenes-dioicae TaxID=796604 RepID=A0A2X0MCX5_9BASI|nr:BQ5605_C004g02668 [Microbotryum silenes-dioicae]
MISAQRLRKHNTKYSKETKSIHLTFIAETACMSLVAGLGFEHSCNEIRTVACFIGPGAALISGESGSYVIVISSGGFPCLTTHAIASWYRCVMSRGLFLNVEPKVIERPIGFGAKPLMPWVVVRRRFS